MTWVLALVLTTTPEFWVVKSGDTCASIAQQVYGSSSEFERLHRLNPGMGPPPHALHEGQTLRVLANPVATVSYVLPAVRARSETHPTWLNAVVGQSLFRNDEVSTLKQAGATLLFRDNTHLILRQNALVVISDDLLRPQRLVRPTLELVLGATRLRLADLRGPSVELHSEGATVAPGAGEAWVELDAAKTTRLSVHRGVTTVAAKGQRVVVPEGQGTVVRRAEPPDPPRPLPPAPGELSVPALQVTKSTEATWLASERAIRYRLDVAQDESFERPTYEATTDEPRHVFDLEPGTSFVRVAASDDAGLWSRPSPAQRIDVVRITGVPDAGEARLEFDGLTPDMHLALDSTPRPSGSLVVDQPGHHGLEVESPRGHAVLEFDVRPPPAHFEKTDGGLAVVPPGDFTVTRDDDPAFVDPPVPAPAAAGHRWRLWWHGALVDELTVPPTVIPPPSAEPAVKPAAQGGATLLASDVALRDLGVGRLASATPWPQAARLEAQLSGSASPGVSGLLALRHQTVFADRVGVSLGLSATLTANQPLGATSALDAWVGLSVLAVKVGSFQAGAHAAFAAQLVPPSATRALRGRLGPSVGFRTEWGAVAADGSVECDESARVTWRAGLHVWARLESSWAFTAQADHRASRPTSVTVVAAGLEHRFAEVTGALLFTYAPTTFTPGLVAQVRWGPN